MQYKLQSAVWEITYLCNMRCKHCGSSCGDKINGELTTNEALNLCDSLAKLGLKIITLSGGEPFMREDWDLIVSRFRAKKVYVNIISNGWFIDENMIRKCKDSGVINIGISIDGMSNTHDFLRKKDSFKHALKALKLLNKNKLESVVCTTVNKKNIDELKALKKILYKQNVARWQFQMASPMGNMLEHPDLILKPDDIERIIKFAYETSMENKINVDLADNIGYFHSQITKIRKKSFGLQNDSDAFWFGCQAGKKVLGIRANGDITGCLSIRDKKYIEGNIRNKSIEDIWNDPNSFLWNRNLKKENLTGFCSECQYGSFCLGGCTESKLTFSYSLYENNYCVFKAAVENEKKKIDLIHDLKEFVINAKKNIDKENYQLAAIFLTKALEMESNNTELIDMLGYVYYCMKNYDRSEEMNLKSLSQNPENAYAWKGYGICLAKKGNLEKGIECLKKSIEKASPEFTDPYYDLAYILYENQRYDEAMTVLKEGRSISQEFIDKSNEFHNKLIEIIDKEKINA